MRCPCCSSDMQQIDYEGVGVHTCDGCGGEFVGGEEIAHIVRTREVVFGHEWAGVVEGREPVFGVPALERERRLRCPACSQQMHVLNYATDSGVFVDRCDSCGGVWLDHEELEKVQVVMERWQDESPAKLREIQDRLERARSDAASRTQGAFSGSRFAFVNALINRFLDAA